MNIAKDSPEVINFMMLFQKLRGCIDDRPEELEKLAKDNESIRQLCIDLECATFPILINERRRRRLFASPVDPKFIKAWRDYEEQYATPLARIVFSVEKPVFDVFRKIADDDANEQANAIEGVLDFAGEQVTQDWCNVFPQGFTESIVEGVSAWNRFTEETGFDLRGIFRRRNLVPFVLMPRHVSQKYGEAEKISLLTHLQQAHDAFVFGMPFAALALMRSILETTLKKHYHADGNDLKARINNCLELPDGAPKQDLHCLRCMANDVLHLNNERVQLPADSEKELLRLFLVLRTLIEKVPQCAKTSPPPAVGRSAVLSMRHPSAAGGTTNNSSGRLRSRANQD